MKLAYTVVILCFFTPYVASNSDCVGTCYSGLLFPKPKDIYHEQHLKGFSYKNITTDDPRKCYSSCVQDCRCKSCQIKDARCELLEEDKQSRSLSFKDGPGYVYLDVKQTSFKGKSHMISPDVCYNGCCRTQPCINGGTCVEHCETPKEKFTCKCPKAYSGQVCEKKLTSCKDVMESKNVLPTDGKYYIIKANTNTLIQVFCDFVSPNQAWTLIESFSRLSYKTYTFGYKAFHDNSPIQRQSPNFEHYRMSLNDMQYFRTKSTMFRATCDFENKGDSLAPDYLWGYLSEYDIINYGDALNVEVRFAYINIRGYEYVNKSTGVWHKKDRYHIHLKATRGSYERGIVPKSVSSEDCFGYYNPYNEKSTCTQTERSTTQWWLGA